MEQTAAEFRYNNFHLKNAAENFVCIVQALCSDFNVLQFKTGEMVSVQQGDVLPPIFSRCHLWAHTGYGPLDICYTPLLRQLLVVLTKR